MLQLRSDTTGHIQPRVLKIDSPTRWGSTEAMVKRAFSLRKVLWLISA